MLHSQKVVGSIPTPLALLCKIYYSHIMRYISESSDLPHIPPQTITPKLPVVDLSEPQSLVELTKTNTLRKVGWQNQIPTVPQQEIPPKVAHVPPCNELFQQSAPLFKEGTFQSRMELIPYLNQIECQIIKVSSAERFLSQRYLQLH